MQIDGADEIVGAEVLPLPIILLAELDIFLRKSRESVEVSTAQASSEKRATKAVKHKTVTFMVSSSSTSSKFVCNKGTLCSDVKMKNRSTSKILFHLFHIARAPLFDL